MVREDMKMGGGEGGDTDPMTAEEIKEGWDSIESAVKDAECKNKGGSWGYQLEACNREIVVRIHFKKKWSTEDNPDGTKIVDKTGVLVEFNKGSWIAVRGGKEEADPNMGESDTLEIYNLEVVR